MSRIAFLYPGQGAQEVGMAGDFYEKSEEAKAVFDQASSILDFDVREICFQKNDLLDKTEYTQAAMVTACLAITRELEKRGLYPEMTAGLSLGEYCAIAAAGSMSDMDALSAPEGYLWNMRLRKEPGLWPLFLEWTEKRWKELFMIFKVFLLQIITVPDRL